MKDVSCIVYKYDLNLFYEGSFNHLLFSASKSKFIPSS